MLMNSYEKLAAVLTLQNANLPTYQSQVGASHQDLEDVLQELTNLEYLSNMAEICDAGKKTVIKIKQAVFNGDVDEGIPPFPVFPELVAPFALVAGVLERTIKRNKRFKLGAGYTKEIGVALGIEEDVQQISPDSIKPTVDAMAASEGYLMSVVVSNRGKSNMWEVQIRRKGSETWETVKTASGKSVDVTITPTSLGNPEKIQVRVRLLKSNELYGQISDAITVTLNP